MRILLLGGLGFLGQHLASALRERYPDAQLVFLGTQARPVHTFDAARDALSEVRLGRDITRPETLAGDFDGVDVVFLLAGLVSFAQRDREKLYRVNGGAVAHVLAACASARVPLLVHVSSCAALGYNDDPGKPVDESFLFAWDVARRAEKHYMMSKYQGTELVRAWRAEGHSAVIVYPGLLFGPGDSQNSESLVRALARQRLPATLPGGTNVVDVRDVADALVRVVELGLRDGDLLLTGANLSFATINRTIADLVGAPPPRFTLPRWLKSVLPAVFRGVELAFPGLGLTADQVHSGFRFRYFSNRRATKVLGWLPHRSFRQSVVDTWQSMNR